MKSSTELKPSMESDTDTKKSSRWFRISSRRGEFDHLMDLYWGGTQGRITSLTLKIIAVNAIALLSLLIGVLYLGQYQSTLIQSKLEIFETEIYLIAAAVNEGGLVELPEDADFAAPELSKEHVKRIVGRFGATLGKRILVFDQAGKIVADSEVLIAETDVKPLFRLIKEEEKWESIEMLKSAGAFVLSLLPQHNKLPLFPGVQFENASDYVDAAEALRSNLSISAWRDKNEQIVLTAAMPILAGSKIIGATMLVSDGKDISKSLGDAWFDILKVFLATLLFTILLSIYLSGVIARPLRRLADAAEKVRKGQLKHTEIPDMSDRRDEIGDLSRVLIDMTNALWERVDSIESFAADVAHEIKNPLTSLKSAVETASIVKKKEDQDRLLAIIQHDIERLDRLITDISSASRLDAELSREAFEPIDLKILLRNLINVYKNPLYRENIQDDPDFAVKNGIAIRLEFIYEGPIFALGSETKLGQVFHNIISNALTFSPLKSTIKITVEKKQNRVSISFEDEGPGIPEENLKTVFERFYSERPKHEDYGKHSGLGLSICKQIIEAHNGMIYAENVKDRAGKIKGARFVVVLNLLEREK